MMDLNALGMNVASGTGAYDANAVRFGANTSLSRDANLTGIANGSEGTLSLWINKRNTSTFGGTIFEGDASPFEPVRLLISTNDSLSFATRGAGGENLSISGTDIIPNNDWVNILISWRTNAAAGSKDLNFHINGVSSGTVNDESAAFTVNYEDATNWLITHANRLLEYADVWFDTTYIDTSSLSNRRRFISADGKPVNLGASGQRVTGSAPILFLSGETDTWHVNKGTGGGFTENGTALTTAPTSPSD